jgi:hypothetical protein
LRDYYVARLRDFITIAFLCLAIIHALDSLLQQKLSVMLKLAQSSNVTII